MKTTPQILEFLMDPVLCYGDARHTERELDALIEFTAEQHAECMEQASAEPEDLGAACFAAEAKVWKALWNLYQTEKMARRKGASK